MKLRFCKDCLHKHETSALCHHPDVGHQDLVSGQVSKMLCQDARAPREGRCGPDAEFFEIKEPVEPV